MRKGSIKNNRINEEVMRELTKIIRNEVKDPRVSPMTSVVLVNVAPDLKTAHVYVSVLGDEEAKKKTIEGLQSSAGFIRRCLAHTVNLRITPELTFVLDESIEYGVNMSHLIDEVNAEDRRRDEETARRKEASFDAEVAAQEDHDNESGRNV